MGFTNKYKDVSLDVTGKITVYANGHCLSDNVLVLEVPGIERNTVGNITDECIELITSEGYDTSILVKMALALKRHCYRQQSVEFCLYEGKLTLTELEDVGRIYSIWSPDVTMEQVIKDLREIGILWDSDEVTSKLLEEELLYKMGEGEIRPEYLDAIGYPHEEMESKMKQMRLF